MSNTLLTRVITELVNQRAHIDSYGISIINLPRFDYVEFAENLNTKYTNEIFFLGFSAEDKSNLTSKLPNKDNLVYEFTVEAAELSRNNGKEDIFRIQIIRNAELEKLSSLKWYPEIKLETIYKESCKLADSQIGKTNSVIKSVLHALMRKNVMNILSFERVLEYLEILLNSPTDKLPIAIKENFYKLGLCAEPTLTDGNPNTDLLAQKIIKNN